MLLVPDKIFAHISRITPALLAREGVKGLALDVDETLAEKKRPLPLGDIRDFVQEMRAAGVRMHIVSNNHGRRVARFAQALSLPAIANACKPAPFAFSAAVRAMGLQKNEVAAVGDQIFTDVCGGHLAGLRVWLVAPYGGEPVSRFYRFRHRFEVPFIRRCPPEEKP